MDWLAIFFIESQEKHLTCFDRANQRVPWNTGQHNKWRQSRATQRNVLFTLFRNTGGNDICFRRDVTFYRGTSDELIRDLIRPIVTNFTVVFKLAL